MYFSGFFVNGVASGLYFSMNICMRAHKAVDARLQWTGKGCLPMDDSYACHIDQHLGNLDDSQVLEDKVPVQIIIC